MSDKNILRVRIYAVAIIATLAAISPEVQIFVFSLLYTIPILFLTLVGGSVLIESVITGLARETLNWRQMIESSVREVGACFVSIEMAVLYLICWILLFSSHFIPAITPAASALFALVMLLAIGIMIVEVFISHDSPSRQHQTSVSEPEGEAA